MPAAACTLGWTSAAPRSCVPSTTVSPPAQTHHGRALDSPRPLLSRARVSCCPFVARLVPVTIFDGSSSSGSIIQSGSGVSVSTFYKTREPSCTSKFIYISIYRYTLYIWIRLQPGAMSTPSLTTRDLLSAIAVPVHKLHGLRAVPVHHIQQRFRHCIAVLLHALLCLM
jgi:hypothetical protein